MMNSKLLLPLIITALVAVGGWFAGHWLSANRDRANKRRELVVEHLVSAYRRLENSSHRPLSAENAEPLATAIADIQLFGTLKEVRLARVFAEQFQSGEASNEQLLQELRGQLRQELGLEAVEGVVTFVRVT